MANPYHHSLSSARKWGGVWTDYQAVHEWFDATKAIVPDVRHRALRHHAEGIFLCEQVFGPIITRASDSVNIPTRWIGEQHVKEDFGGRIPTAQDWLQLLPIQPWMVRGARNLSQELETAGDNLPQTDGA